MKLSEAIRLGAMMQPRQAFGIGHDMSGGTCALMAAYKASGERDVYVSWPWLTEPSAIECPACGRMHAMAYAAATIIVHLNDHHNWSRERIADWVATLEDEREGRAPAITRDALYDRELVKA